MQLTTLILNMFNVLAADGGASFIQGILLWIDRGVYKLVADAFTLFMNMCQMNLNVLYGLAAGLIDRLKALIVVFIVFKLGLALVNYMLNPDKAAQGSKKFLINIGIAAALLISYETIFTAFNELSMLIMGKPSDYNYTVLSEIADVTSEADSGLILRLFFGNEADTYLGDGKTTSLGTNLAINSLCVAFPDKSSTGSSSKCNILLNVLKDGDGYNIEKLSNLKSRLDKTVNGHPGISLILGLFIVFSLVKGAIEIGVRMFKLMILQLIAPIAIITVMSDEGVKSKTFSKFVSTYIEVFISAFIRIISILLITVIISKFFSNWESIIGNATETSSFSMFTMVVAIIAGYKFAGDLPKFIDGILGSKFGDASNKGFGKFLGSVFGAPIGAVAGLAGGAIAGGISGGFSGALLGAGRGLGGGFVDGLKGNSVADKIKNLKGTTANAKKTGTAINAAGGFGNYIDGRILPGMRGGTQDRKIGRIDHDIAEKEAQKKIMDDVRQAQIDATRNDKASSWDFGTINGEADGIPTYQSGHEGIKFGDDKSAFAQSMMAFDTNLLEAQAIQEAFANGYQGEMETRSGEMIDAGSAGAYVSKMREEAKNRAEDAWEAHLYQASKDDATVQGHQRRLVDAGVDVVIGDGSNGTTKYKQAKGDIDREIASRKLEKSQITDTRHYQNVHGTGDGKK